MTPHSYVRYRPGAQYHSTPGSTYATSTKCKCGEAPHPWQYHGWQRSQIGPRRNNEPCGCWRFLPCRCCRMEHIRIPFPRSMAGGTSVRRERESGTLCHWECTIVSYLVWAFGRPSEDVGAGITIETIGKATHDTLLDKITCCICKGTSRLSNAKHCVHLYKTQIVQLTLLERYCGEGTVEHTSLLVTEVTLLHVDFRAVNLGLGGDYG